jgi:thymidylate synthase
MVLPPCHYGFQVYTRELSYFERYKLADIQGYEEYGKRFGGWYLLDENKESNIKDWNIKNIPTRAISLMWNQRSVDTFLGLPFNIASYGLLLQIIAKEVNMVPDELIGNLGDVHLYTNHIEQAKEQIGREPFELPTLNILHNPCKDIIPTDISCYNIFDFELENYQSHPAIKAPLSN